MMGSWQSKKKPDPEKKSSHNLSIKRQRLVVVLLRLFACLFVYLFVCLFTRFGESSMNRMVKWITNCHSVTKASSVLDVGCGNGMLLVSLVCTLHQNT